MGDQAHALGTARVAFFFSVITAVVIFQMIGIISLDPGRFALVLLLGWAVTRMFHDAYRHVGTMAQGVYDRIFSATYADTAVIAIELEANVRKQ